MRDVYKKLPETPGVYLMKNRAGEIIYIGKAGNLKRRVSSYFQKAHDIRIEKLVSEITTIEYRTTESALHALILEASLIKKHQPKYNVREKDDTSFLFVEITKADFPEVRLVRGKWPVAGIRYGPFTSARDLREAFHVMRKIFPFSVHSEEKVGKFSRPCMEYEIGLCPGTCIGAISKKEYATRIRNIKLFFEGNTKKLIGNISRAMKSASAHLEFEKAEELRKQLFALHHIQDAAFIHKEESFLNTFDTKLSRIEGYDISNISGTSAVGVMVVFYGNAPAKSEYRKFKIRTIQGSNDVGMMREVIMRRLQNSWPLPDCILVDGGVAQVRAVEAVLHVYNKKIPVVGIAKGPARDRNDFFNTVPSITTKETLIRVRDEAHRFAITYHRSVRKDNFITR